MVSSSVPIKLIFFSKSAFWWAHADSFLTLVLLSMPKLLIFWAHADTPKSYWEYWSVVKVSFY